jgi:1-acyl-sn-glycerol-3-phosphate acyltransferase
MNGKIRLYDKKNKLAELFWGLVNKVVLARKFRDVTVNGRENLPAGPFLLVCNHVSRWDGLVIRALVNRPANYMVSPNELKGYQGWVLRSLGAFPANPRLDFLGFCRRQAAGGEAIVVFPEGDIYRDGTTHPFKNGAARLALNVASAGIACPVVPCAIAYDDGPARRVTVSLGEPVELAAYMSEFAEQSNSAIRSLTVRLQREVSLLRYELGAEAEAAKLFWQHNKKWVETGDGRCGVNEHAGESDGRILSLENGPADPDREEASALRFLGRAV